MNYTLFLDDIRMPPINAEGMWIIARTYDDAVWYVEQYGIPSRISFDHDLGDGVPDGNEFAKWFAGYVIESCSILPDDFKYVVHSMNPVGANNIDATMKHFLKYYMAI